MNNQERRLRDLADFKEVFEGQFYRCPHCLRIAMTQYVCFHCCKDPDEPIKAEGGGE